MTQLAPQTESIKKSFYVSTPIYYPSNKLHIGNAYTTVLADYIARYHKLLGEEVFFLTGTDEHGQKIEKAALQKGQTPQEFVDEIVAWIKDLWQLMAIDYDYFIRTTDLDHVKRVQTIFTSLYEKGDIYKGTYKGSYCTPCEAFWTATQLKEGLCPDCERPVEEAEEECYFFRLSKYQDRLLELYRQNPDILVPTARINEMVSNFLEPGLQDLAVTRTSFKWGIPVPFDERHVIYVWIDALSNYITALGYPDKSAALPEIWDNSLQLLGKDIVRFHSIIWPALLMALDLPLPKQLYSHGWLMMKEGKMSKSKGNVVDPMVLCERYGQDAIRYFLLSEMPYGYDGKFSNEALIERINSDLANDLGNLYSRTVAMIVKYFAGQLPDPSTYGHTEFDASLAACLEASVKKYHACIEAQQHADSLAALWQVIRRANKYIDETCPWILAKDSEKQADLARVLANLAEVLRQVALCLYPALPNTMVALLNGLGEASDLDSLIKAFATCGTLQDFCNQQTLKVASPLFPRLDLEKELSYLESLLAKPTIEVAVKEVAVKEESAKAPATAKTQAAATLPLIDFSDWLKLDLRVGEVIACEKVPKADKLLHETVKLANGEIREVVSGIAEYYSAEEMVGKQVVLLCNLPERKLRGIVSQAMILTAENEDGSISLLRPETRVDNGATIA